MTTQKIRDKEMREKLKQYIDDANSVNIMQVFRVFYHDAHVSYHINIDSYEVTEGAKV